MLLKTYSKNFFLLLSFLSSSPIIASTIESKCGKDLVQIKILNGSDEFKRRFELYYKIQNQKAHIFFSTQPGVDLIATCIKNKKKQDILIFQQFCGGNSCAEDIYGIFDLKTKKMVLKPFNNWLHGNYKQAEKTIGFPPPFLVDEHEPYFCCYKSQY